MQGRVNSTKEDVARTGSIWGQNGRISGDTKRMIEDAERVEHYQRECRENWVGYRVDWGGYWEAPRRRTQEDTGRIQKGKRRELSRHIQNWG